MKRCRQIALGAALVLAVLLVSASPAFAHAVLLNTNPAPQHTVPRAPAEVELEFSEPVEVAFGAVRVYDVDAHRVDNGALRRTNGDTVLHVPVKDAGNGTFTVTWQVVSADGHAVHGAFQYYVGAPSSRSPAAIPQTSGTSTWLSWLSGFGRFTWYAALAAIAGTVVVRRFVWFPALVARQLDDAPPAATFRRWADRCLPAAAVVALAASGLVLLTETAIVSGGSLWDAAHPSALREILDTAFGRAWQAQFACAVVAVVAVMGLLRSRRRERWLALLAADLVAVCFATAFGGHARQAPHSWLSVPAIAAHFGAAMVWTGGLLAIVIFAIPAWHHVETDDRGPLVRDLVRRFGLIGVVSVAVLVLSGIVATFGEVAHVSELWHTTYGRVLLAKIALLAVALAFAAWHRFVTPRALAHSERVTSGVARFEASSATEATVLIAALVLAAILVALVPPRSIVAGASTGSEATIRMGSHTADVGVDASTPKTVEIHVTFLKADGLAEATVTQLTASVARAGAAAQPIDMVLAGPGHFAGTVALTQPGRYTLSLSTPAAAGKAAAATTYSFTIRGA